MQISNDVRTELARAQTTHDGLRLTLAGQVDRKLYKQIDEVLMALGGRWNRGTKAYVFPADIRPRLEDVLAAGDVTTNADLGFFQTSEPLARELVRLADVQPGDLCLEPSAGGGRIVHALLATHAYVVVVERDLGRRSSLRWLAADASIADEDGDILVAPQDDFMAFESYEPFDRVVMNPPFLKVGLGDHLDHVRHAYGMLVPGGVLVSVLPAGVRFRTDKRHAAFRAWAEARGTITDLPDGSFKESGTDVRTCVVRLVGGVA